MGHEKSCVSDSEATEMEDAKTKGKSLQIPGTPLSGRSEGRGNCTG